MPKGVPKRKVAARHARSARAIEISDLYLKGWSMGKIADELGISVATVHTTLKTLREEWMAVATINFDERKAEELARLDRMERVAWEAWERSTEDLEVKITKVEREKPVMVVETPHSKSKSKTHKPPPKPTKTRLKKPFDPGMPSYPELLPRKVVEECKRLRQYGDPRYLERIAWCIEMRIRLLGLIEEKKVVNQVFVNWDEMVDIMESNQPLTHQPAIPQQIQQALPQPTPQPTPQPYQGEVIEGEFSREQDTNGSR